MVSIAHQRTRRVYLRSSLESVSPREKEWFGTRVVRQKAPRVHDLQQSCCGAELISHQAQIFRKAGYVGISQVAPV